MAQAKKAVTKTSRSTAAKKQSQTYTNYIGGRWVPSASGEWIENRELIQGQDEPAYRVGKMSLGALRDFRIAEHLSLGAGGLFAVNFVPDALAPSYGGHHPTGAIAFVRLKLD